MQPGPKEIAPWFAPLGVAIGVYAPDFTPIYVNPAFEEMCRLGSAEFGSAQKARQELEASFRQHRNKRSGTMRFAQADGSSRIFHVASSSLKVKGSTLRVYTIWGPPAPSSRYVDPEREVFIFGELRVNLPSRAAFFKRKLLPLTEREFLLLAFFVAHEDRLLTKERLLKDVWGKRALGTRTLDVYVSRLKAKLRAAGLKDELIRTQHGQGYLFVSSP